MTYIIWDLTDNAPAELDEENNFATISEAETAIKNIVVCSINIDAFSDAMNELSASEVADIARKVGCLEIREK